MVDWMGEVLHTFQCDNETFFVAVNIMDNYFKFSEKTLDNQDVHIVGIVAMFIASKY